jgi:hypothetical protein
MASNAQAPLAEQTRHMIAQTKTLLNDQLRRVLKEEGLAVSGVKAELQSRIINCTRARPYQSSPLQIVALTVLIAFSPADIWGLQNAGDITGINRVRASLYSPRHGYSSYSPSTSANTPPPSVSPQYSQPIRQPFQSNYGMPPHSSNAGTNYLLSVGRDKF